MGYFNAIPPVGLAIIIIVALVFLGIVLNFTASVDVGAFVCRLKKYTFFQHLVALTGSVCFGFFIYFFISYLFDDFLVPVLKSI